MQVSQRAIASAAARLGLGDRPLMVHSSLASFGNLRVEPQAVLRGLLDGGRTILVPSFSWTFGVPRFGAFDEVLGGLERRVVVGGSVWRVFPAQAAIDLAAAAIKARPELTRCDRESCIRCTDTVAGGPIP